MYIYQILGSKKYVNDFFFEKNNFKIIYNNYSHPIYSQNLNDKNNFIKT